MAYSRWGPKSLWYVWLEWDVATHQTTLMVHKSTLPQPQKLFLSEVKKMLKNNQFFRITGYEESLRPFLQLWIDEEK